MPTVFNHANIVSPDPERLAQFYCTVFDCVRHGPERNLHGEWLERGMGLAGARVHGIFLRLPGHGENGPSLEIFSLDGVKLADPRPVDKSGLMHLCFNVDDAHETLSRILAAGGSRQGEIVRAPVKGVGAADFVYARDPDGNIIEISAWISKQDLSAASRPSEWSN
ncbi:MAG: VOC family protein [Novosphingobium sp.]